MLYLKYVTLSSKKIGLQNTKLVGLLKNRIWLT